VPQEINATPLRYEAYYENQHDAFSPTWALKVSCTGGIASTRSMDDYARQMIQETESQLQAWIAAS